MKKILTASFILLYFNCIFAQKEWNDYSRWSFGLEFGGNAFDGDIKITENDVLSCPSFGAYTEYAISPVITTGLVYNHHIISTANSAFSFSSNINQIYPFIGINFVNLFVPNNKSKWGVWGHLGLGYINFTSSKDKKIGNDYVFYSKLVNKSAATVPISGLLEYNINKNWAVNARYQYSSFNRDDVEGGGKLKTDRYDGVTNDFIASFTIGVRYKLIKDDKRHLRNVDTLVYVQNDDKSLALIDELKYDLDHKANQIDDLGNEVISLQATLAEVLDSIGKLKHPKVEESPKLNAETISLFQKAIHGIQFETASYMIKPSSYHILDQVVEVLKENPNYFIEIHGHTDTNGGREYNQLLSEDRSRSVLQYLASKGISPMRMTTRGFGYTIPIATNTTESGRALNRRVEFVVSFGAVISFPK